MQKLIYKSKFQGTVSWFKPSCNLSVLKTFNWNIINLPKSNICKDVTKFI